MDRIVAAVHWGVDGWQWPDWNCLYSLETIIDGGGGGFLHCGTFPQGRKNSLGYRVMMLLFAVLWWDRWPQECCCRRQQYVSYSAVQASLTRFKVTLLSPRDNLFYSKQRKIIIIIIKKINNQQYYKDTRTFQLSLIKLIATGIYDSLSLLSPKVGKVHLRPDMFCIECLCHGLSRANITATEASASRVSLTSLTFLKNLLGAEQQWVWEHHLLESRIFVMSTADFSSNPKVMLSKKGMRLEK